MVLALVALFVAMSGTTYAVTALPSRSVGSLQLKRGAVRTDNIAGGAVTRAKLAPRLVAATPAATPVATSPGAPDAPPAVPPPPVTPPVPPHVDTYVDRAAWADNAGSADRATLADRATTAGTADSAAGAGSAPSAQTADNAGKLGGLDPSYFLSHDTFVDLPRFTLKDSQSRVILTSGPFTYTANCHIGWGGRDSAQIAIATDEDHSAFDGFLINPDLLATAASQRTHAWLETPTGQPAFKAEDDGTAVAPGGSEVRSITWYVGINLFNKAGRCTFGGFAIV
jgi:hypothetical protein